MIKYFTAQTITALDSQCLEYFGYITLYKLSKLITFTHNYRFRVFWRISTALPCLHERWGSQSSHQIGGCDCANQPLFTCDGGVHFWRSFAVFPVGGLGIPWRFILLLHHFEHNWLWWHGSWRCHWRFYREDQKRMFSFEKFTMKGPIRKEILNYFFGNILNSKIWDYVDRSRFQNLMQTIKY